MRGLLAPGSLALVLTGCGGGEEIWMLLVDSQPAAEEASQSLDYNFAGGQVITGTTVDGPWTDLGSVTESGDLVFAQVVRSKGDDDAVLVFNNQALPGNKAGGLWTFTWTDSRVSTNGESHETGYRYQRTDTVESTLTVTIDISGGSATGAIQAEGNNVTRWEESDLWAYDGTGANGLSSFSSYSGTWSTYIEFVDGTSISNDWDATNCIDPDCYLEVSTNQLTRWNFVGQRMSYGDEDAFDNVNGVTNP